MMKKLKYPNIEAERARRGLSIEELSEMLGVSRRTYHNWIAQGKIPFDKIDALATLFSVSTDYLLGIN